MRQLKITQSITNRESQSLDKYLHEIGKVDLITAEEEVILARKIREGDQAALERLTKTNLRFVVSVAKQYQNQGLTLGDLINEGNLGLIKAAKRFDETKGFKFISYAVWWIRQSILQAIAEQSRIVRLPLNQVGSLSKISKAFSKLEQEYEREPSPEELADILETTVDKISDTLSNSGRHVSMDAPFVQGEENTLLDVLENHEPNTDSNLINESLSEEIKRSLSTLTEREREIIVLFFGLSTNHPLSLEEIGENQVWVTGGTGKTKPSTYKASVGYKAFYLGEGEISYAGFNAVGRAKLAGEILSQRLKPQFEAFRIDYIGLNAIFREEFNAKMKVEESYLPEVRLRVSGKASTAEEASLIGEEVEALYTNGPAAGGGVRKNVNEVIGIVSILIDRNLLKANVDILSA